MLTHDFLKVKYISTIYTWDKRFLLDRSIIILHLEILKTRSLLVWKSFFKSDFLKTSLPPEKQRTANDKWILLITESV